MENIRFSIFYLLIIGFLFTGCDKDCEDTHTLAVDAGNNQFFELPKDSTVLTAVITSGSATNRSTYKWTQLSGPNSSLVVDGLSMSTQIKGLTYGIYVFQFALVDEGIIAMDTVSVTVGPDNLLTASPTPVINGNFSDYYNTWNSNQLAMVAWTSGCASYITRSCLKFDVSSIPPESTIYNAVLYLYSDPNPGVGNSVDAQYGNSNACFINRIVANWTTPSWNNQPAYTTVNQAVIPQSASTTEDAVIDVTAMVRDMHISGNYGFFIRLQNEIIYNSRQYATIANSNSLIRPKLVIKYQ